jgi:hypothetical protein
VRAAARNNDSKSVMVACDSVRDKALPPLGIRLEVYTTTHNITNTFTFTQEIRMHCCLAYLSAAIYSQSIMVESDSGYHLTTDTTTACSACDM